MDMESKKKLVALVILLFQRFIGLQNGLKNVGENNPHKGTD